jgi:hypothetical protein
MKKLLAFFLSTSILLASCGDGTANKTEIHTYTPTTISGYIYTH